MGTYNDEVESTFIRTFVQKIKQDRWLSQIKNPKLRHKLLNNLYHQPDFMSIHVKNIDRHLQTKKDLNFLLRSLGAPSDCYLISAHTDIDGKILPLTEALDDVVGNRFGTVVCCIPDKLAYWEGEGLRARCLLKNS